MRGDRVVILPFLLWSFSCFSQTSTVSASVIPDILATGNAIVYSSDGSQTSEVKLKSRGTRQSRIDLSGSVIKSEIRSDSDSGCGGWTSVDLIKHAYAFHVCFMDASWFFPAFSSYALGGPGVSSVVLKSAPGGRVRVTRVLSTTTKAKAFATRLSQTDYIIGTDGNVSQIMYAAHPDDDIGTDIPIEITLTNYKTVAGLSIPFHIEKRINGALSIQIDLTAASVNTGLQDSDFTF